MADSSNFGSEFDEIRIEKGMIEALGYKLIYFSIPICGPAGVFFNKKLAVKNIIVTVFLLNKRHNTICYNKVIEAQTEDKIRVI